MPASHIRLSSPQNPLGPSDSDTPVIERTAERLAPPPRFTVWLLNDDFTPMEFV
ncbi:MAG: ATP-dependent Clp protease adapter ClpS, partial [Betaproteobacteria bacterium]|nr:ATP-dependent Clp protease adapter ClpS [Betaproteobacteria bacterium]